jgi:hypothetical protein
MAKLSKKEDTPKDGTRPRQVRMPLWLDRWLEEKARADSSVVEVRTVADKIREIVAAAYEADRQKAA